MAIKGISYPFRKGKQSFPDVTEDAALVTDSLEAILITSVGQRVMRPRFGCNAINYVFGNVDSVLIAKVRQEVIRAIQVNEPRVRVSAIGVEVNDNNVVVTVEYVVNQNPETAQVEFSRVEV